MRLTHFILGMAVVLIPSIKLPAQTSNDPLATWDKAILKQANTAASASYLSDEEKKLIFYTNLCRLKPKLFFQTVVTAYYKNNTDKPAELESLQKTLNEDIAMGVLTPDAEFCKMSKAYAAKMGLDGKVGHLDFEKRMKPFMKKYTSVGENCDYGSTLALDAFMRLLVDSSDPVNLGHRKNLLDASFKAVGVAGHAHKTYRWNYVMDFGG